MLFNHLISFSPELILFIGSIILLIFGSFSKKDRTRNISWYSIILLLIASLIIILRLNVPDILFNDSLVKDGFTDFTKELIFISAAVSLIFSHHFMRIEKIEQYEYPILVLLATLGMSIMVSASNLIVLYMGLELQSLALYVIISINRGSTRSSEAGLKYFVLGALSSGILLYGASLIYGITGSINFVDISQFRGDTTHIGLTIGLVFMIAGMAFKISAVPFHMWTPDVYEGSPTPITGFLAVAPKIAGIALLMRVLTVVFPQSIHSWQQIIIFLSIASMFLGAFSAIGQNNIKRLIAYSSIGHIGFILMGIATGSHEGMSSVIIYMTLYAIMILGVFTCILSMRHRKGVLKSIDALAGMSQKQPFLAFSFAILMFSLAGIPPLAGFFGKFYIFRSAINSDLYLLAILGVLASVISAYYYLRIIKIMYIDEPDEESLLPIPSELRIISIISSGLLLLFFIYPIPLINAAQKATHFLLSYVVS